MGKRLLYIAKRMPVYRENFLMELQKITKDNLEISLAFDDKNKESLIKKDGAVNILSNIKLICFGKTSREIFGISPSLKVLKFDYIMFAPELRNFFWPLLIILKFIRIYKGDVILLGHGENFSSGAPSRSGRLLNIIRVFMINRCDLFMGYTDSYRSIPGLRLKRHCSIGNSSIMSSDIYGDDQLNLKLKQTRDTDVFNMVYCGSLYEEKRVGELCQILKILDSVSPGRFRLNVIGDGPDRKLLENCISSGTIKYYGVLFGGEKNAVFENSSLFLSPGFIGLGLLDACAMGVPILLSNGVKHSHEYYYFDESAGYLIEDDTAEHFARKIIEISGNIQELEKKSINSLSIARRYTIENMAQSFKERLEEI